MSELGAVLGNRARAALPAVALLTLGAGVMLALALLAGFAPTPPLVQVVLALLVAAVIGFGAAHQVRAAIDAWRGAATAASGAHRRRRRSPGVTGPAIVVSRPSWPRLAAVTGAVVLLTVAIWQLPGPLRWLFGYAAYALPILPLTLLAPLRRDTREPYPWKIPLIPIAERRMWTREELALLLTATLRWLRERLLTRVTGVFVAVLGLLHLLRGAPGLADGGTRRAGGFAGWLVAEPLRLAFSGAGAIALLAATLVCAGLVCAAYAGRGFGMTAGYAALAIAVVLPLLGTGLSHWFGYDYYLATQGGRVVVVAGLSPNQRHAVYDAGLPVDGLSPSLKTLLTKGLPVADRDDGTRIAKALAKPDTAAEGTFAGDQYELKTGDCFDWIGGSSQLRYVAPCNGNHLGEVYFVGHLPFTVDPGPAAVAEASRAMCEQAYGDYLGVPFGQSFLPMEEPLLPPVVARHGWTPRPVIACWLGSVGPWPLKGTKTVAALQQKVPWDSGTGCKVEVPDSLKLTATAAAARCVAPGPAQRLGVEGAGYTIDLEFGSIGKGVGAARIGAACLDGSNLTSGYTFEVTGDGIIEVWKHAGDQHAKLGASAKPKGIGGPTTAATAMQVSCRVVAGQGVELVANATGSRKVSVVDSNAPITRLSPRLLFINGDVAPAVMNVVIFNATRS
jgi:hypothetical protein